MPTRKKTPQLILAGGPVELDRLARTVKIGNTRLNLGSQSFLLLETLLLSKGKVVPVEWISRMLWPSKKERSESAMAVAVHRLRKALGAVGEQHIRVSRGWRQPAKGYVFQEHSTQG